ncbi:MAG: hypothetical protein HQ546_07495, partial [Planctomycetes bacterium]|nr:hypothetical protein [Planctomycetota bacterium]
MAETSLVRTDLLVDTWFLLQTPDVLAGTRRSVGRTCVFLTAGFLLAGCGSDRPVYQASRGVVPDSVSPKAMWKAWGNLSRSAAAIDGDIRTAAVSYRNYTGDAITIDLNKTCLFQTV